MSALTKTQLDETLALHQKWLHGVKGGTRADLRGARLVNADLRGANLYDVDLSNANLSHVNFLGANLRYANLNGAILSNAIGNNREINTIQTGVWMIVYTGKDMAIGCQQHAISDWWAFDDGTIRKMNSDALEFWRKWKPILMQIMGVKS